MKPSPNNKVLTLSQIKHIVDSITEYKNAVQFGNESIPESFTMLEFKNKISTLYKKLKDNLKKNQTNIVITDKEEVLVSKSIEFFKKEIKRISKWHGIESYISPQEKENIVEDLNHTKSMFNHD